MLILSQRIPATPGIKVFQSLALTAFERTKSRFRYETEMGTVFMEMPRGTVFQDGDLLLSSCGEYIVQIIAKPEPVLTVTANTGLLLLQAAYHLGNRHIPLEITESYLRLSPDPVLQSMLEHLGLQVKEEVAPFLPEAGAYKHSH